MKLPLYALTRNREGLYEKRYLYTKEQLMEKERATDLPDEYEGAFLAWDTYSARKLSTEKEVTDFVNGQGHDECDFEDPTLQDIAEWFSEFIIYDMWDEEENPTAKEVLKELELDAADLTVFDKRRSYLEDLGYGNHFIYRANNCRMRYSQLIAKIRDAS